MLDSKTVDLVLEGEFSHDFASDEAREARSKYVVRRIGTTRSTANATRMLESCQNHGAIWYWGDNSYTVVDIRPA